MSDRSQIEWTEATWNPTTGCTKISPGCAHCYIDTTTPFRVAGRKFDVHGKIPVRLHDSRLEQPLRWARPRRIFVNSLSDLFHRDIPDDFLNRVYETMEQARWHTFQVLTKRAPRMRDYLAWRYGPREDGGGHRIPSRHIWHGVSVENQRLTKRIDYLLEAPSAVRFISAEPLLEDLDLTPYLTGDALAAPGPGGFRTGPKLDWVIVGGESGKHARPFDLAWARAIIDDCRAAGVPVFVKQLGAVPVSEHGSTDIPQREAVSRTDRPMIGFRDRKGGDVNEWPEDLRVREFPERSLR